jgi:DNA polymerase III alpha subunit
LEKLTWEGAAKRYPGGVPDNVATQLRHELNLIERLGYAPYFLTVESRRHGNGTKEREASLDTPRGG